MDVPCVVRGLPILGRFDDQALGSGQFDHRFETAFKRLGKCLTHPGRPTIVVGYQDSADGEAREEERQRIKCRLIGVDVEVDEGELRIGDGRRGGGKTPRGTEVRISREVSLHILEFPGPLAGAKCPASSRLTLGIPSNVSNRCSVRPPSRFSQMIFADPPLYTPTSARSPGTFMAWRTAMAS